MQSTPTMISSLMSQLNTVMAGKTLQITEQATPRPLAELRREARALDWPRPSRAAAPRPDGPH